MGHKRESRRKLPRRKVGLIHVQASSGTCEAMGFNLGSRSKVFLTFFPLLFLLGAHQLNDLMSYRHDSQKKN